MKRLIISDIHNDTDSVDRLLDYETFDEAWCLGDYFHNIHDDPERNRRTAEWLMRNRQLNTLLGNHDLCHRWPVSRSVRCPGWTPAKHKAISEVISQNDWSGFRIYAEVDGFLLSHAGVHPAFLEGCETPEQKLQRIDHLTTEAIQYTEQGLWHPFFGQGQDRGGPQKTGGITWLDWNTLARRPVPGINQIVGHTPDYLPRMSCADDSQNYCLDTVLKFYGILQDGELEIKRWPKRRITVRA